MSIFAVTTSYTFEFALITMIAATIYFFLERYNLSDEYKPVSTLAILTTALAVVEYYHMRDFFSLENLSKDDLNYPTEFRYITWLIATPIMLYTYFVLTKFNKTQKPIVILTISLNFLMIVSGYFAESSQLNNVMPVSFTYSMFATGFASWLGIVFIFSSTLPKLINNENNPNNLICLKCLSVVQKLVTYGWAIYPVGLFITFFDSSVETALTREIIYNFGDCFNKVGFALICFACAKKLSKQTV
jgi:bacteriorhodopsin